MGLLVATASSPSVSLAYAPGIFARFQHDELVVVPAPRVAPDPGLANVAGVNLARLRAPEVKALAEQGVLMQRKSAASFATLYQRGAAAGFTPLFTTELAWAALTRALADVDAALAEEVLAPEILTLLDTLEARIRRMEVEGMAVKI